MKLAVISRYPDATPKQPPLVFVHGAFTDARIWDANFLPYFAAQGYAAHAVSLRGHGLSEGQAQLHRWRLRDYVEDLERTIADLPAAPVLIGHSMGGMVVQKYLETEPDIAGLALMASVSPRGVLPSNLRMALRQPFLFQQMAFFSLFGPALGGLDTLRRLLFSEDVPAATLRDSMRFMQAESQLVTWDLAGLDPLRLNPDQLADTGAGARGATGCVHRARYRAPNRAFLWQRSADPPGDGARHDARHPLARGRRLAVALA
jgi:pimeloyl-ACP methyl ester carboxylesterase